PYPRIRTTAARGLSIRNSRGVEGTTQGAEAIRDGGDRIGDRHLSGARFSIQECGQAVHRVRGYSLWGCRRVRKPLADGDADRISSNPGNHEPHRRHCEPRDRVVRLHRGPARARGAAAGCLDRSGYPAHPAGAHYGGRHRVGAVSFGTPRWPAVGGPLLCADRRPDGCDCRHALSRSRLLLRVCLRSQGSRMVTLSRQSTGSMMSRRIYAIAHLFTTLAVTLCAQTPPSPGPTTAVLVN